MNWLRKECEPYREMISTLLDGELSEVDKMRLKTHLEKCEDCSMLCVAFAATDGLVSETMEKPPAGLHKQIMSEINHDARGERVGRMKKFARPVLAAAACVAIIVGVIFTVGPRLRGGSAAPAAGAVAQGASESWLAAGAPEGDVAAEEVSMPRDFLPEAAAPKQAETPAAPPAPTPEPVPETRAGEAASYTAATEAGPAEENEAFVSEDTGAAAPAEKADGELPSAMNAPADVIADATETAQPEPTPEPEPEPETTEEPVAEDFSQLMVLEMDVIISRGDGYFVGTVTADPTGLLAPGTQVTVMLSPGILAPMQDSGVRIRFDALTGTPQGWLVTAKQMEFTR